MLCARGPPDDGIKASARAAGAIQIFDLTQGQTLGQKLGQKPDRLKFHILFMHRTLQIPCGSGKNRGVKMP
jgi:hypothetical protein